MTVVGSVAVLLEGLVSSSLDETEAVFVRIPLALIDTATFNVTVADAPLARLPSDTVTVPLFSLTVPCEAEPEVNVTPEGSRSDTTTPVAADGPLFVTLSV